MTYRQRIERLQKRGVLSSDGYDGMAADIRAVLALLDEWEKALRNINEGRAHDTDKALALLDKESRNGE